MSQNAPAEGLTPGLEQREPVQPFSAVPRENHDHILVGNGGQLFIPREDLSIDLDDGLDLDLGALQGKRIRRPGRREWSFAERLRGENSRSCARSRSEQGISSASLRQELCKAEQR